MAWPMVWWWPPVCAASRGSRRVSASGSITHAISAITYSAFCQPRPEISPCSTGIIRNWPNEPAAAAMPMAQTRFSGLATRPITP